MRLPDSVIEEVRARARVSDVAREIGGVALKRKGHEWVGLCPFHADRSPSMTVNDNKNLFKCFACGAGGDGIQFVMDHLRLDFPEAVARIAPIYGIDVPLTPGPAPDPAETAARRAAMEERRAGRMVLRAIGEAAELKRNLVLARKIWVAAEESPALVLDYLKARGVVLRGLPRIMRAHRAMFHKPSGRSWPGMVTWLEGPYGFHGIHRTFLNEAGTGKAPVEDAKMTLGSVFETGAAARLQTATERVALVEGIENALIFAAALRRVEGWRGPPAWPVWSVLALEGFRRVVLPDSVTDVLIVPDADESDRAAAEAIIQEAIGRFQAQGRTVYRFDTPEGHDLDSMRQMTAEPLEVTP